MRSSIEEGLYEVDTINLLASNDDVKTKLKALDRTDLIIGWLNGFSRRQMRVYKAPIESMLLTIKYVLKDIDATIHSRGNRSS